MEVIEMAKDKIGRNRGDDSGCLVGAGLLLLGLILAALKGWIDSGGGIP